MLLNRKRKLTVYTVLADASHRSLKLVQDVPQLRDGAIQRNETKANSPRIENPIEGSTSIDDQCIQAVRRLKKRYQDLFVIGEDRDAIRVLIETCVFVIGENQLKLMKGKPAMLELKDDVKVKPKKTMYALQ